LSLLLAKLITRLVLPLGATLVLGALGLLFLALRRLRLAAGFLLAAGSVLWLSSTPAVADLLAGSLERTAWPVPLSSLPRADAILVLGGCMKPALPPREFPEVADAADRVLHAARLYHAGKAPFVLVSAGRLPWQTRGAPEGESMAALLETLGVPRDAIVLEAGSATTYENCARSHEILAARGARDVLLVTSALHMRRALATCRSAGIEARPAPTDYWVVDAGATTAIDWAPSVDALLLSHLALHEWLGYEAYRMRGWVHE
jgi:uncharacterized SAM-binding protein YcdF (DUF218 family)